MPTAEEIRTGRLLARLTQVQLAAELGVTPNTVARWERGEIHPQGVTARLLQEWLEAQR